MDKIPPTISVPPGGVLLNTPQPQRPQLTKHTIDFHTCLIGIYVMLDEDNVCKGYKIQIKDPIFNTEYNLDMDNQKMWDELVKDIPSFPKIGEVPKEIQDGGE